MKSVLKFVTLSFLACAFSLTANANKGACKADLEKFCKGIKPGGGAIMKCLREHQSELSSECKAQGAEMKEKMHAMHESCKADHEKLCAGKKGKEGMSCMKEHQAELSQTCKDSMPHGAGH